MTKNIKQPRGRPSRNIIPPLPKDVRQSYLGAGASAVVRALVKKPIKKDRA